MRPAALAALGIAAYGAILVATIPATVVAQRLEASTGARVRLMDARGTLWRGQSRALVALPEATALAVDRIAWSWNPARLATGALGFEVTAEAGTARAQFEAVAGFGGTSLRNLAGQADGTFLAGLHPLAATWRPGGSLTARATRLDIEGAAPAGDLVIDWKEATVALSEVRPLGSFRAELDAKGPPGAFAVSTAAGPLRLSGRGTFASGALQFSGEARGEGAQREALEPLLALLGPKKPGGETALQWRAP